MERAQSEISKFNASVRRSLLVRRKREKLGEKLGEELEQI